MEVNAAGGASVAVVGTGRVGTAMARILSSRGYRVAWVYDPSPDSRERAARLSGAEVADDPVDAARDAGLVLITTPDDSIASVCERIASSGEDRTGQVFVHMSGSLGLAALEPVARAGAEVACIHPLQTFADLEGAIEALPGSSFGVTCPPGLEKWARGFVADLDGTVMLIDEADRVLYHSAAVIASNLMAMVEYGAQVLFRTLGFTDRESGNALAPLIGATAANVERLGAVGALTGPLVRGDLGTILSHLEALDRLDPELCDMYRAVSLWGLRVVEERGDLEPEVVREMRDLLER
ncbi:MAG: DUF2520 domain-containing protein [Actinobacteria bacterium]|nr:DUF2520 domain-containing protein [Actinomycetota bacterium]MBU1942306.1 DUF2520 domain-containing protein [Actinomycetota bacterium]MBU2686387.1 DUF2520 domain-containing protein [Actinomycetota bacterium]